MIEKPKRPKQPNIQDRQPPRTLQELINRYDLDNTKIYDFLDGLVDLLNIREETVDTDISNLNSSVTNLSNNKVNKSGDTLTGELLFNNKNDYAGIRKIRTINNTDYGVSVGVGANGSARMEYVSNNNVLGSIEVRSNGLYNGVTDKKLAEQSTGWTNATLSSYITGTVRYIKIGNIVIVNFSDVQVKSNLSHAVVLASGLPVSTTFQLTVLDNFEAPGTPMRIAVNTSGQIVDHYSSNTANNNTYYGTLVYITNQ